MIFIVFMLALAAILLSLLTWGAAHLIVLGVMNVQLEIQRVRNRLSTEREQTEANRRYRDTVMADIAERERNEK